MTAAGISCGGTVVTTDPADLGRRVPHQCRRHLACGRAPPFRMQRLGSGSIITLASQLAMAGGRNNSAYIAAKGAIVSLTRTMALDLRTDGIRVNAIAPAPSTRRCSGVASLVTPIPIRCVKLRVAAMP